MLSHIASFSFDQTLPSALAYAARRGEQVCAAHEEARQAEPVPTAAEGHSQTVEATYRETTRREGHQALSQQAKESEEG